MNIVLLAVVPLTDDQLLLNHVIQLVVIIVGLLAAAKMVSTRGTTGKIANATEGLAKRFGADKGLDWAKGRTKAYGKFGALAGGKFAGQAARNSNMGQRALGQAGGPPTVLGRGMRGVAGGGRRVSRGWKNVKAFDQAVQEANEGRGQQKKEDRTARAAEIASKGTIGESFQQFGGPRYAGYLADKGVEQFNTNMKREKATMISLDVPNLKKSLEEALRDGLQERAYAASELLVGKGKPGAADAGEILRTYASSVPVGSEEARTAAGVIRSSGAQFNEVSPDLPRWADDPTAGPLVNVTNNAATYTGASSQKMATWSKDTVDRAHRAAFSGTPAERDTMIKQATDMVGSRYFEDLSQEHKEKYRNIAAGAPPPP